MQLVEQHIISKKHPQFATLDKAAFAAKNLYNATNYVVRQSFISGAGYLNCYETYHLMKGHEAYQALPRKVSMQVLRMLDANWKSFFAAMKSFSKNPEKFNARPRLPRYLHKTEGRFVLVYTNQAISRRALKQGEIAPSGLELRVKTKQTRINQVRIVPRGSFYVVEVVYTKDVAPAAVDPALVAGIDVGLNNLAAITSNKPGFAPVLVNGRPAKHINQGYNKRIAQLKSKLGKPGRTKRMERLALRRT
ncbi:MAG TPA: transposase, partial [Roseiflexaceae bacterium]|nr:transposase [Roseiflexaceae bacterium]